MAKVPDQELKQAFSKLQEKMVETTQKLKLATMHVDKLRRIKQLTELTKREIGGFSEGTKMYESIGRMFLLEDINNIKNTLENRVKTTDEKVKTLENNMCYLRRSVKESENDLREMIQQKQNKETSG